MTMVVGCYTPAYEDEAELMASSLEEVGMAYELVEYADRGDWYRNTAYKAPFLRDQRGERDGPLLYADVDTYFHKDVGGYFDRLQAHGVDFGAHWFRGPAKGHDRSQVREEGWRMLSTVMFLGDTPGCMQLLENWCGLNEVWQERGIWDGGGQKNLWFTVTCMDELHVKRLPGRFNYAFDKPWAYPDEEPCLIEHTVASRDHRNQRRYHPKRRQRKQELAQL